MWRRGVKLFRGRLDQLLRERGSAQDFRGIIGSRSLRHMEKNVATDV